MEGSERRDLADAGVDACNLVDAEIQIYEIWTAAKAAGELGEFVISRVKVF